MNGQPYVVPLRAATDSALAGAKAARLATLLAAGFLVPDGFVISTSAYRDRGKPGVRAAIVQAATQITWPVAVRSSAVGEDSEVASHAGMYETILDVSDQDELAVAVRRCWESAVSERVTGYRGGAAVAMAILVQQMVHPDTAGVMFTADPLTGEDQILISAVPGLGDKLVSGEATADEWVVRGARATRRDPPHRGFLGVHGGVEAAK